MLEDAREGICTGILLPYHIISIVYSQAAYRIVDGYTTVVSTVYCYWLLSLHTLDLSVYHMSLYSCCPIMDLDERVSPLAGYIQRFIYSRFKESIALGKKRYYEINSEIHPDIHA